ncbi:hypothetical protein FDECE_5535 [Fusarium decemcellulare]|nr:hypothetical protein FDECE_5535 [Fusarium decemcellulare]
MLDERVTTALEYRDPPRLGRISKASSLKDRFHLLESQVKDIYGLLQPAADYGSASSSAAVAPESNSSAQQDYIVVNDGIDIPDLSPSNDSQFVPAQPDVPLEMFTNALDIYQTMIHLQPLPLFRLSDLSDYLNSSPRFLLYSFFALTNSFRNRAGHDNGSGLMVADEIRSAEDEVKKLAFQGIPRMDVVQSLCLLALRDVFACQPNQAQMTIGIASRLEACRSSAGDVLFDSPVDGDLSLRCHWSVYILEKIFSPRLCASEEDLPSSDFPASAPVPPPLPSTRREDYPSDLYNPYDSTTDHGIMTCYIKMVSIWGHLSLWLRHIRLAKVESPWLPESKFARLTARIYECDSQLPAKHLLMNVAFSKRSQAEILEQREYWIPWVFMQVQCHAYLSILNHPFIHLVAVRNCSKGSQSGMFLQHRVDSALFHSGWVFWMLQLCEGHQLELYDPFIGHLVAAVATIPWLMQFVEDKKVSHKAAQDIAWCRAYLARVSDAWPHISRKLDALHNLQIVVDHYRQSSGENGGAVTFPPHLIWELLDPEICQMSLKRNQANDISGSSQSHAKIQITTHLTHPLRELQTNQTSSDPPVVFNESLFLNPADLEQVYVDDLMNHFMLNSAYGEMGSI